MSRVLCRVCVVLCACIVASTARAQDAATAGPETTAARPAAIDDANQPAPGRLSRTFSWAESKFDAAGERDGFYPEFGGMITGAGLSIGPGYRQHLFGTRAIVDASAAVSWRRYAMMQSQIVWLVNPRISAGAQAKYQDFTQVNFFGIGRDTLKGDRTNYRLTDLDTLGFATLRTTTWLTVSGRAGVLRSVDIGRGRSSLSPSTDDRFDEITAPSLTRQPGYLHADVAIDADTRDVPGYPSSGGRYRLSLAAYHDQDFASYSFRRVEADAAQYVPIGRTVLALRGRLDLSQTGAGQTIPFYLMPSLGGPKSLRGYLDYRFRDRDLLLVDAEYRLPIARAIDLAMFYDAGTVAPKASALWRRLRTDYGAGVRLHSAKHMLVRLDVARSPEGTRALLAFSAPLSAPSRTIIPYVP